MSRNRLAVVALGLLLALTACGQAASDGTGTSDSSTTLGPEPSTSSTPTTVAATTTEPPTATTTTVTSTTPTSIVDFGPIEGDSLIVVGVAHDDVLNMRSGPGVGNDVIHELAPTAREVVAAGTTVDIGTAFWILVEHSGQEGWVNLSFVAYEGSASDATQSVIDQLGETPVAPSMEKLGLLVAETFASTDPPSDIVMVVAPSGTAPVVVFDVIGLGDDSVRGVRLLIQAEEGDGGFTLIAVDALTLCGRGVDDGLCV